MFVNLFVVVMGTLAQHRRNLMQQMTVGKRMVTTKTIKEKITRVILNNILKDIYWCKTQ